MLYDDDAVCLIICNPHQLKRLVLSGFMLVFLKAGSGHTAGTPVTSHSPTADLQLLSDATRAGSHSQAYSGCFWLNITSLFRFWPFEFINAFLHLFSSCAALHFHIGLQSFCCITSKSPFTVIPALY